MHKSHLPRPTGFSVLQIREIAQRTAALHGFAAGNSEKDGIEDLIYRLNGSVERKRPANLKNVAMRTMRDGSFHIFPPILHSHLSKRAWLAKHLAHQILHYPMVLKQHPKAIMDVPSAEMELPDGNAARMRTCVQEASTFLAELLMPRSQFKKACQVLTWQEISDQFQVPLEIAVSRGEELSREVLRGRRKRPAIRFG